MSRAGQSKPSPMNELVPTISSGSDRWRVVGKSVGDLASFPCLHSTAEDDDRCSGLTNLAGDRFEVVDPGGEDEDVGAISMGHEDIGNDLLEPVLVGDERPVDLGHSAGRRWIGVSGVAESSGV